MRARVTAIAARLFREEGFDAVSMRRIASEAGVSTMSLYDYFPSKREILRGIWEGFFARSFECVERAISRSGEGPRERLAAAAHAYVRYWIEHADQYRAIHLVEDRVTDQERYFVDTSSTMKRYEVFADLIAARRRDAPRDRGAIMDLTHALICSLNGVCHMLITVSEYPWPKATRLVEQVLRMTDPDAVRGAPARPPA